MFDNVLHQDAVVHRLKKDAAENAIPPAILFSGPSSSGKLTAALELARVLSCDKDGEWTCDCRHCRSHRELSHSRTIITGVRDMNAEIAASAEVLRRDDSAAPRYLVGRAARKLLRRFDPILWEGDERKIAKLQPIMERLAETVDGILPGRPLPDGPDREALLDALVDDCAALQKGLPAVLPVAQVRRITAWAMHSAATDHKTVILDSAERMPDASRTALLKFLEEPPPDTTAILITDRKSMLLPTIVSRVRDYGFRQRKASEEAEVLRRVFREDQARWGGLTEYFRAWHSGPSERMAEMAADFFERARAGRPDIPDLSGDISDNGDFTAFLEALAARMRHDWINEEVPDHRRRIREAAGLRDARLRTESLNLPIPLILRGLYLSLGAPE